MTNLKRYDVITQISTGLSRETVEALLNLVMEIDILQARSKTEPLLEFSIAYSDLLYRDPRYRITNSRTSGAPTIDARLTLTGQHSSLDRVEEMFSDTDTALSCDQLTALESHSL